MKPLNFGLKEAEVRQLLTVARLVPALSTLNSRLLLLKLIADGINPSERVVHLAKGILGLSNLNKKDTRVVEQILRLDHFTA